MCNEVAAVVAGKRSKVREWNILVLVLVLLCVVFRFAILC
jgi:hypothetical protein